MLRRLTPEGLYRLYLVTASICTAKALWNLVDLVRLLPYTAHLPLSRHGPEAAFGWPSIFPFILFGYLIVLNQPIWMWLIILYPNRSLAVPQDYAGKRVFTAMTAVAAIFTLGTLSNMYSVISRIYFVISGPVVQGNVALYRQAIGPAAFAQMFLSLVSSIAFTVFVWLVWEDYRRHLPRNTAP